MIEGIVKRQFELQESMDSNKEVMYLALVEELGELVASLGYADWKKVKRDEANILIEMTDMAVFAINLVFYTNKEHKNVSIEVPRSEYELIENIIKYIAEQKFSHIYTLIFKYEPRIAEIVTAKQALNILRKNYGYKDGKYQKLWQDGKEDNEFLPVVYGKPFDEAYETLEDIYTNKVLAGILIDVFDN